MALPSRLVSRVTWWRRAAVSRPWNDKVRVLFFVNKGQRHYIPSTQSNIFVSPLVLFRVLERMVSSRRSCNQVGGHRTGMSSGFFVISMFNAIERKSFAFLKVDYDFRDFGETRAPFASCWQGHVIATTRLLGCDQGIGDVIDTAMCLALSVNTQPLCYSYLLPVIVNKEPVGLPTPAVNIYVDYS